MINEKVEKYLRMNFGKSVELKFSKYMNQNEDDIEIYGFNSIVILTKILGNTVYYKPVLKNH